MAEYCLDLGHQVFGMARRASTLNDRNFKHLLSNPNFKVVYGDLLDGYSLNSLVKEIKPDYFINLAAQSFVGVSWQIPEETFMCDAVGVLKCLEAVRNYAPSCRFYNAGSSEQFGDVNYAPQDELHPFRPRSPYGAAKCAAHHLVKVYRESYNLYAVQGLLFNHESERRGEEFVTRKITKGISRIVEAIKSGQPFEPIHIGNIYAKRDWSHAADFVDGIWRMLNQEEFNPELKTLTFDTPRKGGLLLPFDVQRKNCEVLSPHLKEYVLSSGETHTVKEFFEICFKELNLTGTWIGDGVDEQYVLDNYLEDVNGLKSFVVVKVDKKFFRPAEVNLLLGNSALARKDLGWNPQISFDKMVKRMLYSDLNETKGSH